MRVLKANPPELARPIDGTNSPVLLNSTIFQHLEKGGYSKEDLERCIPIDGACKLGVSLYNKEVFIDSTGKLKFFDLDDSPTWVVEKEEDQSCYHGFVVHDVKGDNRFLCRECDERFPRHPSLMCKEPDKMPDSELIGWLWQFREGCMTLAKVVEKTTLSLNEFKESLQRLFAPAVTTMTHRNIGTGVSTSIVVDQEKQRTSCPQEIDDLFSNPNTTVDDLERIAKDPYVFPDIVKVTHTPSIRPDITIVEVEFIDSTIQRIEVSYADVMMSPRLGITINGQQSFVKIYKTVDA